MRKKIAAILLAMVMLVYILPMSAFTVTAGTVYRYEVLTDGAAKILHYAGGETEVTIPSTIDGHTVTSIGEAAFGYCDWITGITIPRSVTTIETYAFDGCSGIAFVWYEGTEYDRYAIDIQEGNECLTEAKWYYSEGDSAGSSDAPHAHTFEESYREESTCTRGGLVMYTCTGCGDSYNEDLPTIDHDFQAITTADGNVAYVCTNCGLTDGESGGSDDEEEHVHSYEESAGDAADCTNDGIIHYTCYGCGDSYTETIPALGHNFDDGEVIDDGCILYTCVECGETKTEEIDPNEPQIVVESKEVSAGKQVEICVSLVNNPGFSWLSLALEHSPELELVKVNNGTLVSDFTSGRNLVWAPDDDMADDGVLMTILFNVADSTESGEYDVNLAFNECYNSNEEDVTFMVMDGTVTVIDFVYGDTNGDGNVDGKDVVRLKNYLANYDYDTDTSTVQIFSGADANGDGDVDGKDVIRLKKYLANYDYDTESSTVVLGPQN